MAKVTGTLARLKAQMDAGALWIITSEHACGAGKSPDGTEQFTKTCEAFEHPTVCPLHFVLHQAVKLEGPRPNGAYRAFSAEGDFTQGLPEPLLKRLQAYADLRRARAEQGKCQPCREELATASAE